MGWSVGSQGRINGEANSASTSSCRGSHLGIEEVIFSHKEAFSVDLLDFGGK